MKNLIETTWYAIFMAFSFIMFAFTNNASWLADE